MATLTQTRTQTPPPPAHPPPTAPLPPLPVPEGKYPRSASLPSSSPPAGQPRAATAPSPILEKLGAAEGGEEEGEESDLPYLDRETKKDAPPLNPYHVLSQQLASSSHAPPHLVRVTANRVDFRPSQAEPHEHMLPRLAHAAKEGVQRVVDHVAHPHHETAAAAMASGGAPGERQTSVAVDPLNRRVSLSPAREESGSGSASRQQHQVSMARRTKDLPPAPVGAPPSPPPSERAANDTDPGLPELDDLPELDELSEEEGEQREPREPHEEEEGVPPLSAPSVGTSTSPGTESTLATPSAPAQSFRAEREHSLPPLPPGVGTPTPGQTPFQQQQRPGKYEPPSPVTPRGRGRKSPERALSDPAGQVGGAGGDYFTPRRAGEPSSMKLPPGHPASPSQRQEQQKSSSAPLPGSQAQDPHSSTPFPPLSASSSAPYPRILRNDEPMEESPRSSPLGSSTLLGQGQSMAAAVGQGRLVQSPQPLGGTPQSTGSLGSAGGEGFLSPESAMQQGHAGLSRMARRNTTGSRPARALLAAHNQHSSLGPGQRPPSSPTVPSLSPLAGQGGEGETLAGLVDAELDSDILKMRDRIERERQSKRVRAAHEAEEAAREREAQARVELEEHQPGHAFHPHPHASEQPGPLGLRRTTTRQGVGLGKKTSQEGREEGGKGGESDEQAFVGNLIGEKHPNYILMYNMLTGIRIGVSRCQAKVKRPLTDEDYTAKHKFSFDIVGNELTPSAKYDFKFKDYAPWVFRELREECFHLDPADYLLSLTAKYILTELGSPGKSGSFFYFSSDYRFIIKTIHHSEHKFLRSILKDYHEHVKANPHTLLSRFYGLHRVKLPRGRKIHFVIMNNLFPPHRDIHETYDLKGSTVGRELSQEKIQKNPRAVQKDLNWINNHKQLEFGPEKKALFIEQIRRDTEFLKKANVMDYSLLVGIHNMKRGNRDNLRRNTLHVVQPHDGPMRRKPSQMKGHRGDVGFTAGAMRRAIRQSELKPVESQTNLAEENLWDRQNFIFYQDEGGYRATDECNSPLPTIYYLGVIDILTPYTAFKQIENVWKGLSADRHKISPVPAAEYGERFWKFMNAVTRGGGGGESFKPVEKKRRHPEEATVNGGAEGEKRPVALVDYGVVPNGGPHQGMQQGMSASPPSAADVANMTEKPLPPLALNGKDKVV